MLLCQTVEECVSPIKECLRRLGAEASLVSRSALRRLVS